MGQERLGGARADFAANLGRRAAELSTALRRVETQPRAPKPLEELRRRTHALSAGARLLRFGKLAEALGEMEGRLEHAGSQGVLSPEDSAMLRAMLERLPSLVWNQPTPPRPGAAGVRVQAPPATPMPPLTIELDWATGPTNAEESSKEAPISELGSQPDAAESALAAVETTTPITVLVAGPQPIADALAHDDSGAAIEIEREDVATAAIDRARLIAPDLVVVDVDEPGARELVQALVSDPLTDALPILVMGAWERPDEAASYIALGVTKTLLKPVSPGGLRRACIEVVSSFVRRERRREPIGKMPLDELAARLAQELRRGLEGTISPKALREEVDFGEGSDVLAAVWGAVARVRDITTIRSQGAVRFDPNGPEGALPFAPWLGERDGEAHGERERSSSSESRAASSSRLDGLVIVVADDDPAVTWFLADVLGAAGASVHEAHDGARAMELAYQVAPDLVISDVLMPGLDGFGLCRALKRDVALRDAPVILLSWKEDLLQRVRELGAEADGYLQKQASAAAIITRVREVMAPRRRVLQRIEAGGEVRGRLDGLTIRTLLSMVCAARPSSTLSVRDATHLYEVEIRDGRPIRATRTAPDGTFERGPRVLAALVGVGAGRFAVSPTPPASSRLPSIRADFTGNLSEQLLPIIASARAAQRLLSGEALIRAERVGLREDALSDRSEATPEPALVVLRAIAAGSAPRALLLSGRASARFLEDVLADAASRGLVASVLDEGGNDLLPGATTAEMDTLRGLRRTAKAPAEVPIQGLEPLTAAPSATAPTPPEEVPVIVDIDAIAEEVSDPRQIPPALVSMEPSIAPKPTVKVEELKQAALVPVAPPPQAAASISPPPVLAEAAEPSVTSPPVQAKTSKSKKTAPRSPTPAAAAPVESTPDPRRVPRPSSYAPHPAALMQPVPTPAPTSTGPRTSMWILFAVAGVVFAVGARLSRERAMNQAPAAQPAQPAIVAPPPSAVTPSPQAAPSPSAAAPAPAPPPEPATPGETAENPILPQDLPLRPDDRVPGGQGMLEVVAGTSDTIYVDHRLIGAGPVLKLPLAPRPAPYEIRVKLRGEERVRFASVKEGRLTRVRVAPPWTR